MTEKDWVEVESVMMRSVRGAPSGGPYIPSRDERRLLDRARRADIQRYRAVHAAVKEAEVERCTGPFGGIG